MKYTYLFLFLLLTSLCLRAADVNPHGASCGKLPATHFRGCRPAEKDGSGFPYYRKNVPGPGREIPLSWYGVRYRGRWETGVFGWVWLHGMWLKRYQPLLHPCFGLRPCRKASRRWPFLKLRDAGKLRLDDPAELYIPELKAHKYLTADAPKITVRNLMTHSAGFPEDNPWGDRQLADSDADLIKFIKGGISNANVPSFAYEYSNLAFAMLGHIITVVSGKPYQQYITETILKPLGMNDTKWEYTQVTAEKLALGYRWLDDKWVEEPLLHDGSYGAMGGLITSIEDFSKYVAIHQAAWPPRNDADTEPIKRSSIREMEQPWTFSGLYAQAKSSTGQVCPTASGYGYGLGWSQNCTGIVSVGHSGGLPGFGSQWRILPEYGIGVIAYANLTYAGIGSVNSAVLDTLVAIGKLQPRQLPVSSILAQRKADLLKLLPDWKNAEQSGIFAENFFPDKSLDFRRKVVQDLYTKAGGYSESRRTNPRKSVAGAFSDGRNPGQYRRFFYPDARKSSPYSATGLPGSKQIKP